MQKTWAAAAAIAAGLVLAFGQPGLAKGNHMGGKMGKMSTALSLTDVQKAQIKPILLSTREQVKAIKADTTLTPADRKAKMKAIRKGSMAQIRPLLTADQQQKMKAMRGHHKAAAAKTPDAAPAF